MDWWAHEGHIKPLIFSMKPRMGRFTFRQKSTCFRTSSSATSWGVVMIKHPSKTKNDKYFYFYPFSEIIIISTKTNLLLTNIVQLINAHLRCLEVYQLEGSPDCPNPHLWVTVWSNHFSLGHARLKQSPLEKKCI